MLNQCAQGLSEKACKHRLFDCCSTSVITEDSVYPSVDIHHVSLSREDPLGSIPKYYCAQGFSIWWTTATSRRMWTHFLALQICSIPSSPVSRKSDVWKSYALPALTSPLTANQASGAASECCPLRPPLFTSLHGFGCCRLHFLPGFQQVS